LLLSFAFVSFLGLFALGCCLFSLVAPSKRGQALYELKV
jgi:hypothetical protein